MSLSLPLLFFLLSLPPFLSPSSPDIPKLASIPLQQFPAYVSSLHENENEGAEDEYQVYIITAVYFVAGMRKTMNYAYYNLQLSTTVREGSGSPYLQDECLPSLQWDEEQIH